LPRRILCGNGSAERRVGREEFPQKNTKSTKKTGSNPIEFCAMVCFSPRTLFVCHEIFSPGVRKVLAALFPPPVLRGRVIRGVREGLFGRSVCHRLSPERSIFDRIRRVGAVGFDGVESVEDPTKLGGTSAASVTARGSLRPATGGPTAPGSVGPAPML
jgi:hypothetical protein